MTSKATVFYAYASINNIMLKITAGITLSIASLALWKIYE